MLRLRTTTGLSLLALAIGIAGTGWLSTLTADRRGPAPRLAIVRQHAAAPSALPLPRRVPVPVGTRTTAHLAVIDTEAPAAAIVPTPELVPLTMPADTSQPWLRLRGHLDGRVLVQIGIDGDGRVNAARLLESSGDPLLDEHALRSVRGWRFAVPADHPDGFSGELPMRFASRDGRLARLP